jgi:hypothetical protein
MPSEAAPSIVADCSTISAETSQQVRRQPAVTRSLAEVTVLAEPSGASREAFPDGLTNSAMASTFTRYKTPSSGNLDFHPTVTAELLPVGSLVRQIVPSLIGYGSADQHFAALIELEAQPAGRPPESERAGISGVLDSADAHGPGAVP